MPKSKILNALENNSVGSFSQAPEIKEGSREDYMRVGGKQGRDWVRLVNKVLCSIEGGFIYLKGKLT